MRLSWNSEFEFCLWFLNFNISRSSQTQKRKIAMFETFRGKIAFSGITVLSIGIALLVITFASAFSSLSGGLQILSSQSLEQSFGDSLAPLIATSIRIMYLGVMGWIGSLLTIRGVTIIANIPKPENLETPKPQATLQKPIEAPKLQPLPPRPQIQVQSQVQQPPQTPPRPQATKPVQPEMLVIPLEEPQPQRSGKPKSK